MYRSKVNEVHIVKFAARSFFDEDIETVPFATFAEVLEKTHLKKKQNIQFYL